MAVFDSTMLLYLLDPGAKAPIDPHTAQPVTDAKGRVEALVELLQAQQNVVLVSTPVLSEVLVHAGDAAQSYFDILNNTSRFRIVPFGARAAIELAEMTREAHITGDLRVGTDATRAQLRFDRQILAIARVEQDNHIYTDDGNMCTFARAAGFQVTRLREIPLPVKSQQSALPIPDHEPKTEADSGE